MRSKPVHFDVGSSDSKPPKPNRRQRRSKAAQDRKEVRRLRKILEAQAKRRFEALKNQQPQDPAEVAKEYSFG
jgi:hypothetical protein